MGDKELGRGKSFQEYVCSVCVGRRTFLRDPNRESVVGCAMLSEPRMTRPFPRTSGRPHPSCPRLPPKSLRLWEELLGVERVDTLRGSLSTLRRSPAPRSSVDASFRRVHRTREKVGLQGVTLTFVSVGEGVGGGGE